MTQKYDNSGTLGKNERREKETHPTHTGQCTIEGKSFWVSAWVKEGRNGKFFSLSFKPKEERGSSAPQIKQTPVRDDDSDAFDDNIPF